MSVYIKCELLRRWFHVSSKQSLVMKKHLWRWRRLADNNVMQRSGVCLSCRHIIHRDSPGAARDAVSKHTFRPNNPCCNVVYVTQLSVSCAWSFLSAGMWRVVDSVLRSDDPAGRGSSVKNWSWMQRIYWSKSTGWVASGYCYDRKVRIMYDDPTGFWHFVEIFMGSKVIWYPARYDPYFTPKSNSHGKEATSTSHLLQQRVDYAGVCSRTASDDVHCQTARQGQGPKAKPLWGQGHQKLCLSLRRVLMYCTPFLILRNVVEWYIRVG